MTAAQPTTKMAWKASSLGSSTANACERDRMRDRRGRERDAADEDRPQRPPGRAAGRGEPAGADRRERRRRGGGEPAVGVLDRARDLRERADEEDVVRAVVPAARIEEGIAEQRAAERGESSLEVDGDDECARSLRAQHAARVRDDEVEEEREGEAGGERAEAQDERRPALPAGPERREPDETLPAGPGRRSVRRAGERRDDAGRHERETGDDGERGSELGLPGVGRAARPGRAQRRARRGRRRARLRRRRAERGPPEGRGPAPPRDCLTARQVRFVLATARSRASHDVLSSSRSYGASPPRGISAARRVPAPAGLSTRASLRAPRPGRRDPEARSAGRVGAAETVVLDLDPHPAVAGRHGDRDPGCGGVLRDVRERFRADEVRDRLDVRR